MAESNQTDLCTHLSAMLLARFLYFPWAGRNELRQGRVNSIHKRCAVGSPNTTKIGISISVFTDKFQVANTWPKITGRYVYAMVRNGKKPENHQNLLVAATFEKAIT